MTREQLETLVNEATGRSDKTTLVRTALNLAVAEISSQRLWSDLMRRTEVTLVEGALAVDLAPGAARIVEITVVEGTLSRPLLGRSKLWCQERFPAPETRSTSRPQYGYLEGTTLYVVPRPNKDYVLRYTYYTMHPDLDLPTSELLIRHASAAVVAYAVFWVFQSIEKLKEAETWYKTYLIQLASAKRVDTDNSATHFAAVPRGRYDASPYQDYWLDPFVKTQR